MKIKGAIFDFDGTLFDSMKIWDTAGEKYLETLGIRIDYNLHDITKDLSMKQTACYLKDKFSLDLSHEDIISGVNTIVEKFYLYEALPKNGVVSFLERLKKEGASMCVATVTEHRLIKAALDRFDMTRFFDDIVTCEEVGHGKDEPMIYEEAMRRLKTGYDDTMVFEDALYAIRTAHNAGFTTTGIFDQSEKMQNELKMHCDYFINDYRHTEVFWNSVLS